MPIPLRADFDAQMVRSSARRSKDGPQARRLLALAAIYEGARRTQAARIGGVTLQIVRDWVLKFNAQGPEGLIDRKPPGQPSRLNDTASGGARRDHRERPDSGGSWGRALAGRRSPAMGFRRIPRRRRQADVEPRTARHGLSQTFSSSSPSCPGRRRNRRF